MNFSRLEGNDNLKKTLMELESANRMPHAVIISGGSEEKRGELSLHLSMWAVCSDSDKPCGKCKNCLNAHEKAHSDVYYAKGSGKTNIYNKEEIERVIRDASVKPNQADRKVYVLEECDKRLPVISQNAFLKTLEEPPQDVLFIMTCENPMALLETIRSRAVIFTLESDRTPSGNALSAAKKIAEGMVSSSEMRLMKATYLLNERALALDALDALILLLRDGLALCLGAEAELDPETAERLCRKLTRSKFLKAIELTRDAKSKIHSNVSLKLISVWLCAEYRRNVWQK